MMKIVSIIFTMLLLTGMYRVYPCTTWIIAPDGGQYGSAILHKNRDWGNGKEQPVTLEIIRPKKGYKYLQISPYMLLNEAGLALSNNAVAATKDPVYPERMNNRQVLEELAKTCATTQETTEKIKEIAAGGFSQAVIIAACDPDGGAFYELSSEHLAYQETASSSFDLRANDWTLPEMKQISGLKESAKKSSARRANVTRQALSQAVSSPFRLSVAALASGSMSFPQQYGFMCDIFTGPGVPGRIKCSLCLLRAAANDGGAAGSHLSGKSPGKSS